MHKAEKTTARDEKHVDEELTTKPDAPGPDGGPTMSEGGAMPGGSQFSNWQTSMPNPDATDRGSMPKTASTPMPGETGHESRNQV